MFCTRCGTSVQDGSKFCPSCGLDLTAQTPLGRTATEPQEQTELEMVQQALAEEYELHKELGRGGMAIVFKAREKLLDREVAVKVLPFSLAFDAEFVERFQREARTSAKLEHPSIIPIYRVGKSGRVIYFVMKFLRGTSLSDVIEKKGPMAPAEIRKILMQTGSALGYAHKNNIVHRDIKPDNIMFDEMGHAVVTDFGIAKAASGTKLTGTGMSIGTPHYMSPEQARAQSLDGRSDIYSLGVVAYQCLTGRVPFDGEDAFSIGYKHIMEEVPTPEHLPTAEHRKLFDIVKKMMTKVADERFQNAEELIAALEGRASVPEAEAATVMQPAVEAATIAMPSLDRRPRTPPVRPSTPTTPMPRAAIGERPAPKKKRSGLMAASIVLVVLGGVGGGGYVYANASLCPASPSSAICGMIGFAPAVLPVDSAALRQLAIADSVRVADSTARADSVVAAAARDTATTGVLVLAGIPQGARVMVGDREPSPDTVFQLEPGSVQIRVAAANFSPYTGSATVVRGDTARHEARMVPARQAAAPPRQTPAPARTEPATPAVGGQCTDPGSPTYNANGVCFDRGPRLTGASGISVAAISGELPPSIIMLVLIAADGRVLRVQHGIRQAQMNQFASLGLVIGPATQFLMQSPFQPALKNDQPVQAWGQVQLRLMR